MYDSVKIQIKLIVQSVLPEAKVILFGSRARGDNTNKSDYDFLLITKTQFSLREKLICRGKINKLLVYALHSPVDILLNSEEEINTKKKLPGHIVRWALKEGVEL
jgi:predicted nucleotidyltransferase